MTAQASYTLAEIAERWRCCHSHVLTLVRSGQLTAIDIRTKTSGRSRYIVTSEALEAFEDIRTVAAPATPVKKRRKVRRDVIQFFK
jgi:hypothetical protein